MYLDLQKETVLCTGKSDDSGATNPYAVFIPWIITVLNRRSAILKIFHKLKKKEEKMKKRDYKK